MARSSISPVASFGFVVPSGRWATLPVTAITNSLRRLRASSCKLGARLGGEDDLRVAVAVAQVDEQHPLVVAVAVDPAAQGDFLADVRRPATRRKYGFAAPQSPRHGLN